MNANELADVLMSTKFQVDEDGTMIGVSHQAVNEAATMLRQQQARLEKLQELNREYTALHMRQQAEIEALKKLVHQRFDDGKRLGIIETEDRLRKAQEK